MGNKELCGSNAEEKENDPADFIKQITCQLKAGRTIEKIIFKPYFHKINPIKLNNEQSNNEPLQQSMTFNKEDPEPKKLKQQTENPLAAEPTCAQGMSLEEILFMQQNRFQQKRIGVNWNSFIKIKKKDYLQDYIFLKQIGKGAYGSVNKIEMRYGGLFRASKVIKSSIINAESANKGKLFAQISVPIKLDHPNIIKLYEVFEYRKQYVLILELCEGGDLFHYIKKGRYFSESKAAAIIRQILSAVNYMHKQGVTHRDLKPENILVDQENDSLKIADFGTATFFGKEKMNEFVGTPYYIAPQVINRKYDYKCDVWSCGVILYILLCGGPPFNGKNEQEIMNKILHDDLQFKNPIWNKRSASSKELLKKMLNKNADERITAEEAINSKWMESLMNVQEKRKEDDRSQIEQVEKQVVKNLQSFHFKNRLKAVVYTYIASQLYSNKDKEKLLRVFQQIDKDGDGVIEKQELISIFNSHSTSSLSQVEIQKILQLVDTNGSGMIDFTEFLVAASNQEKMLEEQRLENAFDYLDADHSGYITMEQVKAFLDGTQQSNDEIKQIFNEVDENGDGTISKNEFVSLLLKKD